MRFAANCTMKNISVKFDNLNNDYIYGIDECSGKPFFRFVPLDCIFTTDAADLFNHI